MEPSTYHPQLNRRTSDRFRIDCSAMISYTENQQEPIILRDISPRGLGVVSSHSLEIDRKLVVIIQEPIFEKPVKKEATVVWSRQGLAHLWYGGLKFNQGNPLNFFKIGRLK